MRTQLLSIHDTPGGPLLQAHRAPHEAKAIIIGCPRPGCPFTVSARREGAAVNAIANHLVSVHVRPQSDVSGVPMLAGE